MKQQLKTDLLIQNLTAKAAVADKNYKSLIKHYKKLENEFNELLLVKNGEFNPTPIKPTIKSSTKSEATAFCTYSDWHVEEVVNLKTVNGLNKFNPEIAKLRSQKLVQNTLKLVNKERADATIDNLVLHLAGDFIGGWIHDELQQTNDMTPVEASIYAAELLYSAVSFLVDHGKFKRIVLLFSRGNHARTSAKMQHNNHSGTSFETFTYILLQEKLNSDYDNIEFQISDAEIDYFKIYDYNIRTFHGEQVKFGGGIGGLTIPLTKKLAGWDKTKPAHFNSFGHFHQLQWFQNRAVGNGSLKGYDAYAQMLGCDYQEPLQSFQLIDSKRFLTVRTGIFCE